MGRIGLFEEYCGGRKRRSYTGTNYAWVRARLLGGKTAIWGRLALWLSDSDFKAASRDGFGENWPISYKDIEPYYDKVDTYLGISGLKENLSYLPDSLLQRPNRFTPAEMRFRASLEKMGRLITPYRSGVTTDCIGRSRAQTKLPGQLEHQNSVLRDAALSRAFYYRCSPLI